MSRKALKQKTDNEGASRKPRGRYLASEYPVYRPQGFGIVPTINLGFFSEL